MDKLCEIFVNLIGLTETHYQTFMDVKKVRKLRRKDIFISAGDVCEIIGFINNGNLRSFVKGNNEEFNTDFYFQHYFVSAYSSFITNLPTEHAIEAITDSEIYTIEREQYAALVAQDVQWLKFGKYIAEFFLIRKCKREISFMKQTAKQRMEGMLGEYPGIEQIVPQYHIASYLGIKPESLSRIKLQDHLSDRTVLLKPNNETTPSTLWT